MPTQDLLQVAKCDHVTLSLLPTFSLSKEGQIFGGEKRLSLKRVVRQENGLCTAPVPQAKGKKQPERLSELGVQSYQRKGTAHLVPTQMLTEGRQFSYQSQESACGHKSLSVDMVRTEAALKGSCWPDLLGLSGDGSEGGNPLLCIPGGQLDTRERSWHKRGNCGWGLDKVHQTEWKSGWGHGKVLQSTYKCSSQGKQASL